MSLHYTQYASLITALVAMVVLALKAAASFLTGSMGLFSDAAESGLNVFTAGLAFAVVTIARMPADANHPYGHEKVEFFSTGVMGVLILLTGLFVIFVAFDHWRQEYSVQQATLGIVLSAATAVCNGWAALWLRKVAHQYNSLTLAAEAKHLLIDLWTTLLVIFGLLIVEVRPDWHRVDVFIGLLLGGHILVSGAKLIKTAVDGLMDAALPPAEILAIEAAIQTVLTQEMQFYRLRTRYSGPKRFVDLIVRMPGTITISESHAFCDAIEAAVEQRLPNTSVLIHVEPL